MRKPFFLAVILSGISSGAMAEEFICESDQGLSPYDIEIQPNFDHVRFAPAQTDMIKEFESFTASFDGPDDDDGDGEPDLYANLEWVAYELQGLEEINGEYEEPEISIKRPSDWYKSPEFAFLWTDRSGITKKRLDNSYDNIGAIWNRGHMAMGDHAQRISWQASCNTHTYWNGVPQAAEMNQGPWLHLETYVAALSNKYEKVWTIAGTIFDEDKIVHSIFDRVREDRKGEVPVAVPHALFKILVLEIDGQLDVRAFIFEQPYELAGEDAEESVRYNPIPTADAKAGWVKCSQASGREHTYDHRSRLVSVSEIERRTGLTFFEDFPELAAKKGEEPTYLWPVEKKYWTGFICGGQNFIPENSN